MIYKKSDRLVKSLNFDEIKVGDEAALSHLLTWEDVQAFAELTGDFNPLHLDKEFAKKTLFQKPVVHGMLSASFISTMIGMLLPGGGALWMSQTINFLRPAFVGDTIRVAAVVKQKSPANRMLVLKIAVSNQHGDELISGEAMLKMLERQVKGTSSCLVKEPIIAYDEIEPALNNLMGIVDPDAKRTVLLTGGSGGIGEATALKLAAEGHTVVINYLDSADKARDIVARIKAAGGRAIALKANIADSDELADLFLSAEKVVGPILAVVHCAAPANVPQPFANLGWDDFQKQLDIHLKGAFNCVKCALPRMLEYKAGDMVFLGTIYTTGTPPTQQARYVVAKSALTSLARCLAVEYGPMGIRANVVAPGMTQTSMIADLPDKVKMLTKMQTPLRRLAEPVDIANSIAFLLSPAARHITGETLRVCGGTMMV